MSQGVGFIIFYVSIYFFYDVLCGKCRKWKFFVYSMNKYE